MEGMDTFPSLCPAVRNWVKEGRIGRLKYLDSSFFLYAPRIRRAFFSAPHGGGAAFDVGIYCLAFSLSMTGQLPDSCRSKLYVERPVWMRWVRHSWASLTKRWQTVCSAYRANRRIPPIYTEMPA